MKYYVRVWKYNELVLKVDDIELKNPVLFGKLLHKENPRLTIEITDADTMQAVYLSL